MMNDEQIEALRTKYGFDRIGIIEGEMYLPMKEVFEKLVQRWIPCSERLPETEADVMLSLRSLDVYTGFMANTEGCFYVEGEGYVEAENVLAWMPLPEPYKEEGEENE